MKQFWQWFRYGLLGLALIATPAYAAKDNKPLSEEELKALQKVIAEIEVELKSKKSQADETSLALKAIEKKIALNAKRMRRLTTAQRASLQRLKENRSAIRLQKVAINAHIKKLYYENRAAYLLQGQKELKLLLGWQDPAMLSRKLRYLGYFKSAHAQSIAGYNKSISELTKLNQELKQENHSFFMIQEKRQQESAALKQNYLKRSLILKTINNDIASGSSKLQQLRNKEKRLSKLLSKLSDLSDIPQQTLAQKSFAKLKGHLKLPTRGRILRASSKLSQQHARDNGIIIAAPKGQDVQAIHSGRVAYADWLRGFGLLVIIDHGDGYMTLYAHNQTLYKEVGDWVEHNEVISTVGDSGGLDKPALYFEIRKNGQPISSKRWLAKRR